MGLHGLDDRESGCFIHLADLEAEVAQRRERGERRRERPRQAGVLEVEVVDAAGAVAGDVRPRARVPVVGPPQRVRVRQRLPKVLQRCLVQLYPNTYSSVLSS